MNRLYVLAETKWSFHTYSHYGIYDRAVQFCAVQQYKFISRRDQKNF